MILGDHDFNLGNRHSAHRSSKGSQMNTGSDSMSYASRVWRAVLEALSSTPQKATGREDVRCVALILVSFAVGLAVSWQRWGNPVVDSGRELNAPLRLARGEMLYSDVRYIYGPLSPYINAALFRIFHPSLWVLWGRGIVSTVLILGLVYWLARQVLGPFSATLGCLAVTWLCALKSQGNYVLPYAYSGLDGGTLVLAATAMLLVFLRKKSLGWLFAAGIMTVLAALAKTEMGAAAIGTGLVAVALAGYPRFRRIMVWLAVFLAPALVISAAVYAWFAWRVGWHTLTDESYLFFGHLPWQFIYYNKLRFGFGQPGQSLGLMILSLLRLIALASFLASISLLIEKRGAAAPGGDGQAARIPGRAVALLLVSLAVIALTGAGLSDLGPFMAMPFLLLALIAVGLAAFFRAGSPVAQINSGTLVLLAVSGLLSLARIVLRVSTGGALSSFLLPVPVALFVYVWLVIFPLFLLDPAARRRAAQLTSIVLALAVLLTAVTLSVRYRRTFTYPIVTSYGTWRTWPDVGVAFTQALQYIEKNTAPGDVLAAMPEGTTLNFLSGRRNPMRDEIVLPGFLNQAGEEGAIERLRSRHVPLVFILNLRSPDFGEAAFGEDYNRLLMSWIKHNYSLCGVFGSDPDPNLPLGSPVFFIRGYCLNPSAPFEHAPATAPHDQTGAT